MTTNSLYGQVVNRPSGQTDAEWQPCGYSLSADVARREARAHHDADCCEPDWCPLDWGIQLDDGSVVLVFEE